MRRLIAPIALLALVVPAASLAQDSGGSGVGTGSGSASKDNPCTGASAAELKCPNLVMGTPSALYAEIGRKRTLLRATNRLTNIGRGPMELRGRRKSPLRKFRMVVTQAIRKRSGGYLLRKTGGMLFFKPIPGQYRYWKFIDAASLEVWSLNSEGKPDKMVRRSPKQVYCLRDLIRLDNPPSGSPKRRHYPGCNQDPNKRRVTLGTSVGWIDQYPSLYYQQYVDVTGLKGKYAYVMTADPKNRLAESDEEDNSSYVTVTLPPKQEGYLPGY
jgi:hypothetical protein